jgi:hypothetical protein
MQEPDIRVRVLVNESQLFTVRGGNGPFVSERPAQGVGFALRIGPFLLRNGSPSPMFLDHVLSKLNVLLRVSAIDAQQHVRKEDRLEVDMTRELPTAWQVGDACDRTKGITGGCRGGGPGDVGSRKLRAVEYV